MPSAPQKTSYRLARIEAQLMRKITQLIKTDLEDPRLLQTDIHITRLRLSRDLKHARVFFTVNAKNIHLAITPDNKSTHKNKGASAITAIAHALNHSVSYLRREISRSMELRLTPELFFVYDQGFKNTQALINLINSLPVPKDTPS